MAPDDTQIMITENQSPCTPRTEPNHHHDTMMRFMPAFPFIQSRTPVFLSMDNKGCYYFCIDYFIINWHSSFSLVTNLINASYICYHFHSRRDSSRRKRRRNPSQGVVLAVCKKRKPSDQKRRTLVPNEARRSKNDVTVARIKVMMTRMAFDRL